MGLNVIVLAAGAGRRMASRGPKVLLDLGGRSLLEHVLASADRLAATTTRVVVGHGADAVRAALPEHVEAVVQPEQRGTGDAVAHALTDLPADSTTLVLCGDVPLVRPNTLQALVAAADAGGLGLLTVEVDQPTGYGRILREPDGSISGVVEERDATPAQREGREINTGLLAMETGALARHVASLDSANTQGEFYLTDIVGHVRAANGGITAVQPGAEWEVRGVNNRAQLAALERRWQQHQAEALMGAGVSLRDPARIDVRGELIGAPDAVIDVGCVFQGRVELGPGATIGAHCVLRDTTVETDAVIEPHCVLEAAHIGTGARVGPFARMRPGCRLAAESKIGNFVETKNLDLGRGSKINHLAYIGDTRVGTGANIGAGVITCNYDGHRKHRTDIGDRAFIGSDCQLVAPVRVGDGATLGAGTTLTRDAPAESLTVGRARTRTIEDWVRPADREDD